MIPRLARAIILLLLAAGTSAQAAELTLDTVLRSSAAHAPQVLEALARQRQSEARVLGARGQFDLVFESEAKIRALGWYDGSTLDVQASRPLTGNGGALYGGYRLSLGDFPVYDGKSLTNGLGEVRVGAVFALLRDRVIDERRGRLALAEGDVGIAALEAEMVAIGVQRRAVDAYQQWVAAGLRMALLRDLLALAEQRQDSIERQIALGARPPVLEIENRQNIIRRRALLVRAEQDLQLAANALSLFLRDDLGRPVVPTPAQLPPALPAGLMPDVADQSAALSGRPDMKALIARIEQTGLRASLADNDLRPRLDLRIEGSQDFGTGSATREPAEALIGLKLAVPLQRRAARGRLAEALAERDALTLRRQQLEEQIGVELANLGTQMNGAAQLAQMASEEAALARRMAEAERRRFALGASDFLLVNLREEALADAALREIDAHYRSLAARAELVAALADKEQLRL